MDDFVCVQVYTIVNEDVSVVTYKTNDENKLSASQPKILIDFKKKLTKEFLSYNSHKLNLNLLNNFLEDTNKALDQTESIIVQKLPSDVLEDRKLNLPAFIQCQNCENNFPTKYQYQRHQCNFASGGTEHVSVKPVPIKKLLVNNNKEDVPIQNFECNICKKKFISQNNLDRHVMCHSKNPDDNICEYCNKYFITENRLKIHMENHCKKAGDTNKFYRSDVTVWKCKRCNEVFSSQEIGNHHTSICSDFDHIGPEGDTTKLILNQDGIIVKKIQKDKNENRYVEKMLTELLLQCEFCNRTYADKNLLLMHQRKHTTQKNYECVNCFRVFDSYLTASSHWLQKCSEFTNFFYLPKLTFCEYCDRTFKSHEILYNHKVKKRHYTPKLHFGVTLDKEIADPEIHPNLASLTQDILKKLDVVAAKTVGLRKEQNEPENLSMRIKSEPTSENSSSASILASERCHPNILKKRRYSRSKRYYPTFEEGFQYQCQLCIKVFKSVTSLDNHRSNEHVANFRCGDCGQTLQTIKALLIHSRAHRSLKPYVCDTCGRSYSQTSHLWQHMRFHQGIKPFACPHEGCEARYTIRPDLKDHIRKVHTRERPFKCNVCNKCFLTGSVYYQHRLIHTNDRRYACDLCPKRFFRADALNNHRRIHTDERPYPCAFCGREFRQKGDRNKHMRTQHTNQTH